MGTSSLYLYHQSLIQCDDRINIILALLDVFIEMYRA